MSDCDEFSYHEMLDRLSVMQGFHRNCLIEHPVAKANPALALLLARAADIFGDAYQMVGNLSPVDEPEKEMTHSILSQGITRSLEEWIDSGLCVVINCTNKRLSFGLQCADHHDSSIPEPNKHRQVDAKGKE